MCVFVEESVSLGVDFDLQEIKLDPVAPFLLSADSDVELFILLQHHVCLYNILFLTKIITD